MCLSALRRLVDATDDSAIAAFMVSFSAARLNGLCFRFLSCSLSFLDFLAVPDIIDAARSLEDVANEDCLECDGPA
jgi:hypothetical protein